MDGSCFSVRTVAIALVAAVCGCTPPPSAAPIPSGNGKTVTWTLVGARAVRPRAVDPSKLVYEQVYPGVALTLESRGHAMVYRFDVSPGGDPAEIRMRYRGVDDVAKDTDGSLSVRAGGRTLRERGLQCFQEIGETRRDVSCSYDVTREDEGAFTVALGLGSYDRKRKLVIDPEIGWSSYLGGNSTDWGNTITVDGTGNVYVVGMTSSWNFPAPGGFDTTRGNGFDGFVAKVSADGSTLLWSSFMGGDENDEAFGIVVDDAENVYVAGLTLSPDFACTGGFDTTLGYQDAFIAKVDASGSSLDWCSFLGGSSYEAANSIALDSLGYLYVAGGTGSTDFPISGAFDTTPQDDEAFVAKIDPTVPSLMWSSYLGGSHIDEGKSIAVDGAGNVYVTGDTWSSDFPVVGGFDSTYGGNAADAFVTKVDASGSSIVWSTYLGGSAQTIEHAKGIAVDAAGNVYVVGETQSSDFPSVGGFDTSLGEVDAFVTKVDAAGSSIAWSSFLGGDTDWDYAHGVTVDHSGNVYVTGFTWFDPDGRDAFVAKVDASGSSLVWLSYLGGSGDDYGNGIAVDDAGVLYVTGRTDSSDFPTIGGFDTTYSTDGDAFVTQIRQCDIDGACGLYEDACTCPADCGADSCGNGCCGPSEDSCACPDDCPGDCCGDAVCGHTESTCTCPADCPGPSCCGNGTCDVAEDACGCPADCSEDCCGDGTCGPTESACTCPADCTTDVCGDGCCTGAEDCVGCAADCGPCAEPGPEPTPDMSTQDGPAADAGSDLGADLSADLGADQGGLDLGVDQGVDLGADLSTDLGVGPGADLGADLGTDLGTNGGSDAAIDSGVGGAPARRSGCSCAVGMRDDQDLGFWLLGLALVVLVWGRSRREKMRR